MDRKANDRKKNRRSYGSARQKRKAQENKETELSSPGNSISQTCSLPHPDNVLRDSFHSGAHGAFEFSNLDSNYSFRTETNSSVSSSRKRRAQENIKTELPCSMSSNSHTVSFPSNGTSGKDFLPPRNQATSGSPDNVENNISAGSTSLSPADDTVRTQPSTMASLDRLDADLSDFFSSSFNDVLDCTDSGPGTPHFKDPSMFFDEPYIKEQRTLNLLGSVDTNNGQNRSVDICSPRHSQSLEAAATWLPNSERDLFGEDLVSFDCTDSGPVGMNDIEFMSTLVNEQIRTDGTLYQHSENFTNQSELKTLDKNRERDCSSLNELQLYNEYANASLRDKHRLTDANTDDHRYDVSFLEHRTQQRSSKDLKILNNVTPERRQYFQSIIESGHADHCWNHASNIETRVPSTNDDMNSNMQDNFYGTIRGTPNLLDGDIEADGESSNPELNPLDQAYPLLLPEELESFHDSEISDDSLHSTENETIQDQDNAEAEGFTGMADQNQIYAGDNIHSNDNSQHNTEYQTVQDQVSGEAQGFAGMTDQTQFCASNNIHPHNSIARPRNRTNLFQNRAYSIPDDTHVNPPNIAYSDHEHNQTDGHNNNYRDHENDQMYGHSDAYRDHEHFQTQGQINTYPDHENDHAQGQINEHSQLDNPIESHEQALPLNDDNQRQEHSQTSEGQGQATRSNRNEPNEEGQLQEQNQTSHEAATESNENEDQDQTNREDSASPSPCSFSQLGIMTSRPKNTFYSMKHIRLASFENWQEENSVKKEDLAEAGFYFRGLENAATCFYCGGTLQSWEPTDDPWVEHCRFFPLCQFVRLYLGSEFIRVVQEMQEAGQVEISRKDVCDAMGPELSHKYNYEYLLYKHNFKTDPAVLILTQRGFSEDKVIEAALALKEHGAHPTTERLYYILKEARGDDIDDAVIEAAIDYRFNDESSSESEHLEHIRRDIDALREQMTCKVCTDKPVEILFLPCSHLVCCVDCACVLESCPLCRTVIRGSVRAYIPTCRPRTHGGP